MSDAIVRILFIQVEPGFLVNLVFFILKYTLHTKLIGSLFWRENHLISLYFTRKKFWIFIQHKYFEFETSRWYVRKFAVLRQFKNKAKTMYGKPTIVPEQNTIDKYWWKSSEIWGDLSDISNFFINDLSNPIWNYLIITKLCQF